MAIHWSIDFHENLDSTQVLLKQKAEEGAAEGLVVQAVQQSAGYGRHGRQWVSEPGNLYLSILLHPDCALQDIGHLSILAGLAVGKTIKEYAQTESIQLKWPNDVLLEGKKCAGLILETGLGSDQSLEWVAIGIGINLVSTPSDEATYISASDLNAVRDSLLAHIDNLYSRWQQEGFEDIKQAWLAMAHPEGTNLSIKLGKNVIQGSFKDIDDQGNLLILNDQGAVQKITSGDVYV